MLKKIIIIVSMVLFLGLPFLAMAEESVSLSGEYSNISNSIFLSWEGPSATSYEVERKLKDEPTWHKVGAVEKAEFTDFFFEPEKIYLYRIRPFGSNAYSNEKSITTGKVVPNITSEGGTVEDITGFFSLNFPAGAVRIPAAVLVESVDLGNLPLAKGAIPIGQIYTFKIKNETGKEVKTLNAQIDVVFNLGKISTAGLKESSFKVARVTGNSIEEAQSYLSKDGAIVTLTDHSASYLVLGEKASPVVLIIKIFLVIIIIGLVAFGIFLGVRAYQLKQYQKEHRDDFIYRH